MCRRLEPRLSRREYSMAVDIEDNRLDKFRC